MAGHSRFKFVALGLWTCLETAGLSACGTQTPRTRTELETRSTDAGLADARPIAWAPTERDWATWRAGDLAFELTRMPSAGMISVLPTLPQDPREIELPSPLEANPFELSTLQLRDALSGRVCTRAFLPRTRDLELQLPERIERLRLYVLGQPKADLTLLLRLPDGSWRCNDDHGHLDWSRPSAPTLELQSLAPGTYGLWVGDYDQIRGGDALLFLTYSDENHP